MRPLGASSFDRSTVPDAAEAELSDELVRRIRHTLAHAAHDLMQSDGDTRYSLLLGDLWALVAACSVTPEITVEDLGALPYARWMPVWTIARSFAEMPEAPPVAGAVLIRALERVAPEGLAQTAELELVPCPVGEGRDPLVWALPRDRDVLMHELERGGVGLVARTLARLAHALWTATTRTRG